MRLDRTLLRDVRTGDTILDIGANIGGYTYTFRTDCPESIIHAFEPVPSVFAALQARYVDDPAIHCWNLGVGATCEVIDGVAVHEAWTINRPGETIRGRNATYGGDLFDMTVTTIDVFMEAWPESIDRVRAIKIDTDGYDFRVLQGALKTIMRCRPRILIEFGYPIADLGDSEAEMLGFIDALGYTVYDGNGAPLDTHQWRSWYPFNTTADFLLVPNGQSLNPTE